MKYTRQYVESLGRLGAGILTQTDEWYLVRVLNSVPIYCHKEDHSVTPSLLNYGFWESWITTWFLNNVGHGTVFVDVGANTGYYAFLAERHGAKVMAFEPNPKYAKMIRATIGYNHSSLRFHEAALSDEDGTAVLNIPKQLHGSASFNDIPGYEVDQIEVQTKRLDSLVSRPIGKWVFKLDVEGAEEKVLTGMQTVLSELKNPIIMMEYTPNAYSPDFLNNLFDNSVAWINYAGEEEPVSKEWIRAQTDWVMLTIRKK